MTYRNSWSQILERRMLFWRERIPKAKQTRKSDYIHIISINDLIARANRYFDHVRDSILVGRNDLVRSNYNDNILGGVSKTTNTSARSINDNLYKQFRISIGSPKWVSPCRSVQCHPLHWSRAHSTRSNQRSCPLVAYQQLWWDQSRPRTQRASCAIYR